MVHSSVMVMEPSFKVEKSRVLEKAPLLQDVVTEETPYNKCENGTVSLRRVL